jgi:hypothetical protein
MFSKVKYRVWQSWKNLTDSLSGQDHQLIRQVLSPEQYRLFLRMAEADQAHSFRVFQALIGSGEDHPDLLTAALLHDAGKAGRSFPLWKRTAAVLLERWVPEDPGPSESAPSSGWKQALDLSRRHPARGAELARKAGASPLAVRLIRYHQTAPEDFPGDDRERELLIKLIQADNQN